MIMTQPPGEPIDDGPHTFAYAQPAMASAIPVPDNNPDTGDTEPGNED
jgi:hypothetical protein